MAVRDGHSGKELFSQSWYRVAGLKPRLRSHSKLHHHIYRGNHWYVLQDYFTGQFHRFSPEAYLVIGLMDGKRAMTEIWESACRHLGDDMPTQDEVIGLLAYLHRSDLLYSDSPPDISELHERKVKGRRKSLLNYLLSPVSLRLPLVDPNSFLDRTYPLVAPLFGKTGFFLWLLVVLSGLAAAGMHWRELTFNITDRVLSLENLFIIGLVYPAVKVLHELGHAYSVKRWGGEVHEMGVMFLVFVPIPYVDASASTALGDKKKRMLVGGSGIMVELFLAALAVLLWVNAEPGVVRSVAYNVIFVGSVSTLFMNGNPLLRFDAYYMLSDCLEIPNLGARSNGYIGYLLQRYLLGKKEAVSPVQAPGEGKWLGGYSTASFLYRIFIMVGIILLVAGKFFLIGVLLAAWTAVSMFVLPMGRVVRYVTSDLFLRHHLTRVVLTAGLGLGLFAALVLLVPMPSFTVVEGVVWVPEESVVYAGADGVVSGFLAKPGSEVRRGDGLILCESPELEAEVRVAEARLREVEARLRASMVMDRAGAEILREELGRARQELAHARQKRDGLLVRSQAHGRFLVAQPEDLPGVFVRQGNSLGYVVDFSQVVIRVVVNQDKVDLIRNHTARVEARLAEAVPEVIPTAVLREVPGASKELPSMALSLEGGGKIVLDPKETKEPKAFEKFFHFDLSLSGPEVTRIGERVFVRFVHDPEPLASRWHRGIRRMLLKRFNV